MGIAAKKKKKKIKEQAVDPANLTSRETMSVVVLGLTVHFALLQQLHAIVNVAVLHEVDEGRVQHDVRDDDQSHNGGPQVLQKCVQQSCASNCLQAHSKSTETDGVSAEAQTIVTL